MSDEIKQVVSVEDQASAKLKSISDAEVKLADSTKKAGGAADKASADARKLADATDKQTASVKKAEDEWAGFGEVLGKAGGYAAVVTAAFAPVIQILQQFIDKAREAAKAASSLVPNEFEGLAANVGGGLADEAFNLAGANAGALGMNVADFQKLQGFLGGITDVREIKDPLLDKPTLEQLKDPMFVFKQAKRRGEYRDQLARLSQLGGNLQAATSGAYAGPEAASLMQLATERLNITDEQAVSLLTGLGTSGVSMADARGLIEKGGDINLAGLTMASRGKGLPGSGAVKQMNTMLGSLTRIDETGAIAPELAALGLTVDMKGGERVQRVFDAFQRGQIDEGELFSLTGGQATAPLRAAIMPALRDPAAIQREVAGLLDPGNAPNAIAAKRQSELVQAKEAQNNRELQEHFDKIKLSKDVAAQALADAESDRKVNNAILPQVPWIDVGLKDIADLDVLFANKRDQRARALPEARARRALQILGDQDVQEHPGSIWNDEIGAPERERTTNYITNIINSVLPQGPDYRVAPAPGRKID